MTKRLNELEIEINKENLWNNFDVATNIHKEYTKTKKIVDNYKKLMEEVETLEVLKNDFNKEEYLIEYKNIEDKIIVLEKETHLNGEYDNLNCYLEIHPGAGGTESCDWASMILKMYEKFCEKNNYKYEVLYETPGDEAGIKSALIIIKGENAYGFLKRESGIHRLVRISPFDSNARRHTSFASVTVTPEFIETSEVEVKDVDLKIDVYHSSGAGGQSVNTSNSAVRITHLPSKIVVTCQNERSQLKNKEIAIRILKSKLYDLYLKEQKEKINSLKNTDVKNEWGSQIRSYILEPYKLVKDSRSGFESNEPEKILDGEIYKMLDFNLKNINKN